MFIYGGLIFKVLFEKRSKDDKKNDIRMNDIKNEWMKTYGGSKLWSLLFGLDDFTHELIGLQTNNILLLITWGHTMNQKMFKFLVIGLEIFWFLI
jgi:hypothetical protein